MVRPRNRPPNLDGSEGAAVPKETTYIGSYNWVGAPIPTIIVPGQRISSSTPPPF